jgi:hypothetical protein
LQEAGFLNSAHPPTAFHPQATPHTIESVQNFNIDRLGFRDNGPFSRFLKVKSRSRHPHNRV